MAICVGGARAGRRRALDMEVAGAAECAQAGSGAGSGGRQGW